MRLRTAHLAVFATMGVLAVGCGDEKSQRQPTPTSEQNMMRMLRTNTGPAPVLRRTHERKESDMR